MSTLVLATIIEQDEFTELINQLGRWKIKRKAKLLFIGQCEDATVSWKIAAGFKSQDEAQRFVSDYRAVDTPTDDNAQFEILSLPETPSIDALEFCFRVSYMRQETNGEGGLNAGV